MKGVTRQESLVIVKRLVGEIGTPRLLRLMARITEQHAHDLLRQGASHQAARCTREATILSLASEALLN